MWGERTRSDLILFQRIGAVKISHTLARELQHVPRINSLPAASLDRSI
jgi:hypothetical protein